MPLSKSLQQVGRTFVRHGTRRLIYFGGCDYYRLGSDPAVLRALEEGVRTFGLNVAASRATTGNHVLFGALEKAVGKFFHASAALFSSGYVTNLAYIQTFAPAFTHAFIDERSHGSLRDAAELLPCPVRLFRHRDADDLMKQLRALPRTARPLVLTDGLFSHDGSVAPLEAYVAVLPGGGTILVDDAHAAGVLGRHGRGTPEHCRVRDERIVQTISLSKAFGVYGGAVLATPKVIKAIQERCRVFNGNTPLPLPLANAALKAVNLLRQSPEMRTQLAANIRRIKSRLQSAGYRVPANDAPLIAFVPRNARQASSVRRDLLRRGIFPTLIRYANGPAHGYFRFAISSEHTPRQLDSLAEALLDARVRFQM